MKRGRKRSAVVGLIPQNDKFLAIQRSATVRAPLKWCFPGGMIEPNESVEEALIREFREELDLKVQPVYEIYRSRTPTKVQLHWWLLRAERLDGIHPDPNEVKTFAWMTLENLLVHPELLPSNQPILEELIQGRIPLILEDHD